MPQTALRGNPVNTTGDLPAVGSPAPHFELTGTDLSTIGLDDYAGQRLILNIFPSVDTPTCAASVRQFNERAAALENTTVLCISADLPFAHGRFCGAEGIESVTSASTFKNSEFLESWGVGLADGPLEGLCARAVIVVDEGGNVVYVELVPEIGDEPDYDAAIAALG